MLIRTALVLFIHLAFFVSYPETGAVGVYYIMFSALIWSGASLLLGAALFLRIFPGKLIGKLITIVFLAALALFVSFTMPQSDGVSVSAKLKKGDYPTARSIRRGLANLSRQREAVQENSEELRAGIKKAAKEIKR